MSINGGHQALLGSPNNHSPTNEYVAARSYFDIEDPDEAPERLPSWQRWLSALLPFDVRGSREARAAVNSPWTLESMDYNPPNSAVYREWLAAQPHSKAFDRWFIMFVIGLLVGITSFTLSQTIVTLFSLREQLGRYFLSWDGFVGYVLAWLSFVLMSGVAALVASALVVKFAPAAAASGVPNIMAYLNGVRVPKMLNLWTFVVKFLSCALAVAAGLPVGPEGPLIHMGAIIGAAVSGMHSTTLRFDLGVFRHLRDSKHRRDFVTAGVAAGVAAAFDAPLGGLLFAFEEVASFWHSHLGWQIFFCCTIAVLAQNLLKSLYREIHHTGHFGFFNDNVTFEVGVEVYAHVLTIVPATVLGAIAGVFAIAFTKLNLAIASLRRRFIKVSQNRRMAEVVIMTLVYVGVCMLLPHMFPCRKSECTVPISMPSADPVCPGNMLAGVTNSTLGTEATNEDLAMARDPFTCPDIINPRNSSEMMVHYNSMATLVNPLGEDTISRLFARGQHREFGYAELCTLLIWYTLGAAWAAGMDISSGMFVPMFLIGAVLGRILGLAFVDIFSVRASYAWMAAAEDPWKWVDPGVFAVLGAAAFMGGVTRLTIALATIMMEVSSDVQMLLPVLVSILVAKAVADTFLHHGYYHSVMEAAHFPFLPPVPDAARNLDEVPVRAAMASPVITIPRNPTLHELEEVLRSCPHNGFPVTQPSLNGSVCFGLITRNHLNVILEAAARMGGADNINVGFTELNRHVEDPLSAYDAATQRPADSLLADEVMSPSGVVPSPPAMPSAIADGQIDLSRFVNRSVHMVQEDFSLGRAYALFTSMGLRHMVVVDEFNRCRGIVTRKDLHRQNLEHIKAPVQRHR